MRRSGFVIAGLALAVVWACTSEAEGGREAPSSSTTAASTSSTAPTAGSDGCGGPAPRVDAQRLVRGSIESSGGTREYMVYVPDAYDPAVAAPLAYVFHGAGSNKEQQLVYSGYAPYADRDGALLVLPDALGSPKRWSPFGPQFAGVEGVNDLTFFDDLSAEIEGTFCVDPERVLVTGMSSGGYMSGAVGCTHSEELATVGPVTATVWAEPVCGSAEPVAYVYFHGTADPIVPYDGGANSPGPVTKTSQDWATQNGCTGDPVDERIGDDVVHRTWEGCEAGTDLYTVEGGGHTWPGAIDRGRGGGTTQTIDATEIIWDVFRSTWPET